MADNFYLPPDDPDLDRDYITGREYMDGMTTGIKTISSELETNVVFNGDGAATDGKNVYLPAQCPESAMTLRQVNVGRGYGNHEALHQILTDMEAWHKFAQDNKAKGLKWTTAMGNAIEDIRIEHGGLTLYPGIAKSIDHTAEAVTREAAKQFEAEPELASNVWSTLPLAVTWAGRVRLGYPSPALTSALDNLAPDIKERAFKIADAVLGLDTGVEGVGKVNKTKAYNGTKGALDLAVLVTKELAEEEREKPTGGEPTDGEECEDGEGADIRRGKGRTVERDADGDGSSEHTAGEDDGRSHEGETGDGSGSEGRERGEPDDAPDGTDGRSEGGGDEDKSFDWMTTASEYEPLNSDLDQVKDMLDNKKTKRRSGKTIIYAPICTSSDGFFPPFCPDPKLKDPWWCRVTKDLTRKEFAEYKTELGARVATMRRKFEQALITKTRSEWVGGRTGKLDVRRRGVGIMRADDKIFRKLEEADAIDTCVTLLVDCSGSMRHNDRIVTAAKTAIAIATALDGAGIPVEVLGHTAIEHPDNKVDREARYGAGYWARRDAVRIFEFKTFDKPMRQCVAEMGAIGRMSLAHNADPDAYRMVGHRLAKRTEARKVMMVLADGRPEHVTDLTDHELSQETRRAVQTCADMGIDMVGIGIQYSGLKEFFPDYVIVRSMDDLSREVMDRLAKLLLGNRFHIDNSALINVAS
tara:strand:+ start:9893 stop:11983 length:2091 start_codon:yes stop_codon:yes gene_type:complete